MTHTLTKSEESVLDSLVKVYIGHQAQVKLFHDQLLGAISSSTELSKYIHSIRSRTKNPQHLKEKLCRKMLECKAEERPFDISGENLFTAINDLVGIRVLHLYTRQIQAIDPAIREVFQESKYDLLEGPFARTWDDESRDFFSACNITPQASKTLYTSVHYVVGSNSRTKITAEIQVRTLMEEVWGEVNHTMNYPQEVDSLACREQLKVLARVTSSASRLVDSIFLSVDDHNRRTSRKKGVPKSRRST